MIENSLACVQDNAKIQKKWFLFKQALATTASCLIPFSGGLVCGISSTMLPELRKDMTILYNSSHESWIASISTLSMVIGSLLSGPILDKYGRKLAHIFLGIPFVIGWIIVASAKSTSVILLGRFLTGISTGACRSVTLVYIGEISDPKIRAVGLFMTDFVMALGIWICHSISYCIGWRISSIVFIAPALASLLAFFYLKESPLWLISKGRIDEGVEIFRWFRGTDDMSESELRTVLERQSENPQTSETEILKVIGSKAFIKPMLILIVTMINLQISGPNAIGFHSLDVYEKLFSNNIDPFVITMAADGIRVFVGLVLCVVGIYAPRKLTFSICNFGAAILALSLTLSYKFKFENSLWITMLCLVVYITLSSVVCCVGWSFVPELLPTTARGLGAALTSTIGFTSLFTAVQTLPFIMNKYNITGLFIVYGLASLICAVILCFTLKETNGKTLQSIEDSYSKKNVNNVS